MRPKKWDMRQGLVHGAIFGAIAGPVRMLMNGEVLFGGAGQSAETIGGLVGSVLGGMALAAIIVGLHNWPIRNSN